MSLKQPVDDYHHHNAAPNRHNHRHAAATQRPNIPPSLAPLRTPASSRGFYITYFDFYTTITDKKLVFAMDAILKKYQQKFKKVREEMNHWDELQSQLISHFSSASSIIQKLELIGDKKNYGNLKGIDGIEEAVLQKQMDSLETILLSIQDIMKDFHKIVVSLEKMVRDSGQLVRGGSHRLSTCQLQQKMGVKPNLSECLEGLAILQEMHSSEYLLKASVISALLKIALKPSSNDLGALRQLLVDQPNIPRDEVQLIYDVIFAEDMR